MKIIGMVMSVFLFLNVFPDPSDENQLVKIIEVANQQDITITSWKVYIQESIDYVSTKDEVEEEIKQIMTIAKGYSWNNSKGNEGEHHFQKIGRKTSQINGINEQASITVYEDGEIYRISLSYEITGNEWSAESGEYIQSTYQDDLKNNKVYYSVYGTKDYRKGLDLEKEADTILKDFSAERVEAMEEEQFISISAYKKDWDMKIPTKDNKQFNLQVGLRVNSEKEKVDVAIGTPIITSGY
jgi:hypothetical protein